MQFSIFKKVMNKIQNLSRNVEDNLLNQNIGSFKAKKKGGKNYEF